MTPKQIDLVQASFEKVVPHAEMAAGMFYARLFEMAPDVKPLFKGDMKEQGRKLMATLRVVVNGLKNLDAVVPAAQALAVKHVAYGVKPEYYPPVGDALIWTLETALKEDFDSETRAGWIAAYTTLSQVMIAAAYSPQTAE